MDFLKHKKLYVVGIVIVVVVVLYLVCWNMSFSKAKELYSEKQYFEAKDKIDHFIYMGNDIEYNKIMCAGRTLQQLHDIEETLNKEYFSNEEKAELIAYELIDAKQQIRQYYNDKKLEEFISGIQMQYLFTTQELGVSWGDIKTEFPSGKEEEAKRIARQIIDCWSK